MTTRLPPYTARPRAPEWFALAAILILAALLRLGMPGVIEFKQDEANLSLMALDLARGRSFPLLGIDSSVGIRNPPVNVYLLAFPFLFSSDPTLATQYIGALNVVAVLLAYLLARRYYGPLAAIIAGLLYAVGPWAVLFSRKVWAQEMLPPFVLLTIGTGLLGFVEGKRRAQLLHLPLLAITGQIHYVTFILLPITLYLVLAGRRRLTHAFLLSIPLAALTLVPFAIGAVQASLLRPETLARVLSAGESPRALALTGEAFQYAILTIAGTDLHSLAGPEAFQHYLSTVPDAYPLFNGLAAAVGVAALWLAWRGLRRRDARTPVDVTLLIWLLFTPLAFSITWTPVFTHYLIPIFPAAFIVLGAALADLWRGLAAQPVARRAVFGLLGAALALLAGLQVWLVVSLLSFLNSYATTGAFGTPLGYYLPIREAVLAARPAQVLARLDGQYVGYNEEASLWNFLLYDLPLVRFLDQGIDVYSAEEALYLSHECDDVAQRFYLRSHIDSGATEGCYAISAIRPGAFDSSAYTRLPESAAGLRFANGARITAYRWEPVPEGCLSLVWAVEGPATGHRSDFFNIAVHFVNAADEKILDADNFFWLGRYWRAGDTIVRRFCLRYGHERIGEIAGVRLGMYTFEDTAEGRQFYGVDVLDADDAPAGQWIALRFTE